MGRHKAYDRQKVLEKAMDLFWKKGFEGAHLQELVEVTGLNRFSLYKEFGGKEGLFERALELYLEGLKKISKVLWRKPLGLDNILEYLQQVISSDFTYGCFMVNTLTQQHVVHSKAIDKVKAFAANAEKIQMENLEAAKAAGEIPPDVDVAAMAKFLLVFDIGLVTYEFFSPTMKDKEHILAALKGLFGRATGNLQVKSPA